MLDHTNYLYVEVGDLVILTVSADMVADGENFCWPVKADECRSKVIFSAGQIAVVVRPLPNSKHYTLFWNNSLYTPGIVLSKYCFRKLSPLEILAHAGGLSESLVALIECGG